MVSLYDSVKIAIEVNHEHHDLSHKQHREWMASAITAAVRFWLLRKGIDSNVVNFDEEED